MANETKPIKEWLEMLDEPYRTQALENYTTEDDETTTTLSDALWSAFAWEKTPQGLSYWYELCNSLETQGL